MAGGRITEIVEKPVTRSKIIAGVYVLNPEIISEIDSDFECDMPSVLDRAISNQLRVTPFQLHEDWLDVGRQTDLAAVRDQMRNV